MAGRSVSRPKRRKTAPSVRKGAQKSGTKTKKTRVETARKRKRVSRARYADITDIINRFAAQPQNDVPADWELPFPPQSPSADDNRHMQMYPVPAPAPARASVPVSASRAARKAVQRWKKKVSRARDARSRNAALPPSMLPSVPEDRPVLDYDIAPEYTLGASDYDIVPADFALPDDDAALQQHKVQQYSPALSAASPQLQPYSPVPALSAASPQLQPKRYDDPPPYSQPPAFRGDEYEEKCRNGKIRRCVDFDADFDHKRSRCIDPNGVMWQLLNTYGSNKEGCTAIKDLREFQYRYQQAWRQHNADKRRAYKAKEKAVSKSMRKKRATRKRVLQG